MYHFSEASPPPLPYVFGLMCQDNAICLHVHYYFCHGICHMLRTVKEFICAVEFSSRRTTWTDKIYLYLQLMTTSSEQCRFEDWGLQGCYTDLQGYWFPVFWRNTLICRALGSQCFEGTYCLPSYRVMEFLAVRSIIMLRTSNPATGHNNPENQNSQHHQLWEHHISDENL